MDTRWTAIAGIISIAVYAGLNGYALYLVEITKEEHWVRVMHILGGFEAIAFAGAGFLFGKEVNRDKAVQAQSAAEDAKRILEEEKKKAEEEAKKAAEEKSRADNLSIKASAGTRLADAIRVSGAAAGAVGIRNNSAPASAEVEALRELRSLVDELFPR